MMKTEVLMKQKEPSFWAQQTGTINLKGKDSVTLVREARRKLEREEKKNHSISFFM